MYLKRISRRLKGRGREQVYYTLYESFRSDGRTGNRFIVELGKTENEAQKRLKRFYESEPLPGNRTLSEAEYRRIREQLNTDIWGTPQWVLERVRTVFGGPIDLDPCTQPSNPTQALQFYTEDDDGLRQEWKGTVYMNPPYSTPKPWLEKLVKSYQSGAVPQGIALVKAGVFQNKGTHPLIATCSARGYWIGRLCFESLRVGRQTKAPDFDVAIAYWGPHPDRFREQFADVVAF